MGTAFKMVLNMLLAVSMTAFAEALVFGQALGLTSETLFSLLNSSPVIAPAATGKQPKINSGDYTADFPLQWMHKDLHLAALTAYDTQPPLLLATLTKELYQAALKQGYGDQDFAAIYAYLQNP
jgi:3-hydroxyisobutyrate dehydrogenase/glyoxylate/succinic semialdehyde reductase